MGTRHVPGPEVVRAALVVESVLACIALVWILARELPTPVTVSWRTIVEGLRATGPLLAFNFGVFAVLANQGSRYSLYREFRDDVVRPLCADLTVLQASIAAAASGIGEELFFRGAVQPELVSLLGDLPGTLSTAFLFSYGHFLGAPRRMWPLVLYYLLFGLYFSMLFRTFGDLFPCVIAHSVYNFAAMLYIRHLTASEEKRAAA